MVRVGLVIYSSIETLIGGYLYDRRLLDHLVSRGDRAEVISVPGGPTIPAPSATTPRLHWSAGSSREGVAGRERNRWRSPRPRAGAESRPAPLLSR